LKKTAENTTGNLTAPEHFVRSRLNELLDRAIKKPLVIVYAGAGCGKTNAVRDFTRESGIPVHWVQLSEQDNALNRFREAIAARDRDPAVGSKKRHLIVLDDFYLIHDPEALRFAEQSIREAQGNRSVILICRDYPQIHVEDLADKGEVAVIQEDDLNFTKNEVYQYLDRQGFPVAPRVLYEIMRDTNGWALAVNLVARFLEKSPGYGGYTGNAFKKAIFEQMEAEEWAGLSKRLKGFLARLSLIEHFSGDLVGILASEDETLLAEFKARNAYARYHGNIDAYLINPLFLEFLRSKQGILSEEEKRETCRTAALWCLQNGFMADALRYYEQIGDYESITQVLLCSLTTADLAGQAQEIFERAPAEVFERVEFLPAMRLFVLQRLGRWQESLELGEQYEKAITKLEPKDSDQRNHILGGIYFSMGLTYLHLCTRDDRYDFKTYFSMMNKCFTKSPVNLENAVSPCSPWIGVWANFAGSARAGAPQEFIDADAGAIRHISHCLRDLTGNYSDLARGELAFYRNEIQTAQSYLLLARARARGQHDQMHRALFYMMRAAVMQGDQDLFEQSYHDISELISATPYDARFITVDIATGWYYYILRRPEMIPGWLKGGFVPYAHSHSIENFENLIKARVHFLIRKFSPLLVYIEEMKQRESSLYGRVEMLALEACARYQMKDRAGAFAALREAWETAAPNGIIMPLVELGRDMRTLTTIALREAAPGIPKEWLKSINAKAHLYAKYQVLITAKYDKEAGAGEVIPLSPRETMVLQDLYAGLSRADIAEGQNLSINTVNMNVRSIYTKLQVKNTADLIRVATELKLV